MALSQRFGDAIGKIVAGLPALLGAIAILIVGYIVAKVLQTLTRKGLEKTNLDESLRSSVAGRAIERVSPKPSSGIARVVFWVVMIGVISWAVSALGVPALSLIVAGFYRYVPNILAAFLIFLVAVAVSAGAAGLVNRTMGETPTGKLLQTLAPGIIVSIAVFMILVQLKIAPAIVTITFAALIGSVALMAALAFGLGGREVAARMLEQAYTRGQERMDQVRGDLALGKQRTQEMAEQARQSAQEGATQPQSGRMEPVFGESREAVNQDPMIVDEDDDLTIDEIS